MAKAKKYTQEALEKQLEKELNAVPEIKTSEAAPEIKVPEEEEKDTKNLSDIDLSEFTGIGGAPLTKYTTDMLDNLQKIEGTISTDDLNNLIRYNVKGGERPGFADTILTQSSYKLEETLKIVSLLQSLVIPELLDRQMTLRKTLLSDETLKNMSYDDMTTLEANISKEIKDIIEMSLKVYTQLNRENKVPTAYERAMNLFMGLSVSDRERIMDLIEDMSEESQ